MRSIWLCLLFSFEVLAGGATARKAVNKQAEAGEPVSQDAQGGSNPNAIVNRLRFLGQEGYGAHELASLMLREPDLEKRRSMAQVIAGLANKEGEPGLLRGLEDEDGAVRMYSAQGLGRMKS